MSAKMTQLQMDIATVQGWRQSALDRREPTMVAFYERLLDALEHQCGLPSSIVDALNSGDGTYRP